MVKNMITAYVVAAVFGLGSALPIAPTKTPAPLDTPLAAVLDIGPGGNLTIPAPYTLSAEVTKPHNVVHDELDEVAAEEGVDIIAGGWKRRDAANAAEMANIVSGEIIGNIVHGEVPPVAKRQDFAPPLPPTNEDEVASTLSKDTMKPENVKHDELVGQQYTHHGGQMGTWLRTVCSYADESLFTQYRIDNLDNDHNVNKLKGKLNNIGSLTGFRFDWEDPEWYYTSGIKTSVPKYKLSFKLDKFARGGDVQKAVEKYLGNGQKVPCDMQAA